MDVSLASSSTSPDSLAVRSLHPRNRRVRCDLGRPRCDRCAKAGKQCSGYRNSVTSDEAASAVEQVAKGSSALTTLPRGTRHGIDSSRFELLGCEVLHRGGMRQQGAAASFWTFILPQLGQADDLVRASMAACGAALEACLAPSTSGELMYSCMYGVALRRIQQNIAESTKSSLALVAACLLLAISEVLTGQELAALSHLQGMLLLLQQRQQSPVSKVNPGSCLSSEMSFDLDDEIDVAGAILDISTASYALGLEPRLPCLTAKVSDDHFSRPNDLFYVERRVLKTLHSSYTFASTHNRWRYVPNKFVPKDTFIGQSQICADLFQRIQEIGLLAGGIHTAQVLRALTLRAQCSVCLIYLQMLLDPMETGYDRFKASFRSIVEDAEVVLRNTPVQIYGYIDCSLDLGVIQPLYFTAFKCRDLVTRLEAVKLLQMTGREGPFDGTRFSTLARRVVELETGISNPVVINRNTMQQKVIPERMRVHSAGIDTTHSPGIFATSILALFSRCRDVDSLLNAESPNEYEDPGHWEKWDELLPLVLQRQVQVLPGNGSKFLCSGYCKSFDGRPT